MGETAKPALSDEECQNSQTNKTDNINPRKTVAAAHLRTEAVQAAIVAEKREMMRHVYGPTDPHIR